MKLIFFVQSINMPIQSVNRTRYEAGEIFGWGHFTTPWGGGGGGRTADTGTCRTEIYLTHGIILKTQLYFTATELGLEADEPAPVRTKTDEGRRRLPNETRISPSTSI